VGSDGLDDTLRHWRRFDDERRAGSGATEQLVQSVVETERQEAQDSIALGDAEVADHGLHPGPEIAVRYRHALR
jgi:hypothetical protein